MLDENQQNTELKGFTAGAAVVALQCISRLLSAGAVRDVELEAIAICRKNITESLKGTVGIDYDQVRLQQEAALRQAQSRGVQVPEGANGGGAEVVSPANEA
jgi:hypothetical protein